MSYASLCLWASLSRFFQENDRFFSSFSSSARHSLGIYIELLKIASHTCWNNNDVIILWSYRDEKHVMRVHFTCSQSSLTQWNGDSHVRYITLRHIKASSASQCQYESEDGQNWLGTSQNQSESTGNSFDGHSLCIETQKLLPHNWVTLIKCRTNCILRHFQTSSSDFRLTGTWMAWIASIRGHWKGIIIEFVSKMERKCKSHV